MSFKYRVLAQALIRQIGGGIFNHFDGSVDLLDDLDDHYTARTHKKERNWMIEKFQEICKQCEQNPADHPSISFFSSFPRRIAESLTNISVDSVRVTILGGDVHLAALGRFYSNPSLNIPCENDHRYMANVVSSAIVNKPPPQAIANLLARRNKIHHLNPETDETLLKLFNKDPGDSTRTANHNQVTMPSRNFAMLTENSPNNPPRDNGPRPVTATTNGNGSSRHGTANGNGHLEPPAAAVANGESTVSVRTTKSSTSKSSKKTDGHLAIHHGEENCGTHHKAASPTEHGRDNDGSLDICIRVEIDQHNSEGRTESYGLTIPALTVVA